MLAQTLPVTMSYAPPKPEYRPGCMTEEMVDLLWQMQNTWQPDWRKMNAKQIRALDTLIRWGYIRRTAYYGFRASAR